MIYKVKFYSLLLFLSLSLTAFAQSADSAQVVEMRAVEVVSSVKENGALLQQPSSVTAISREQMQERQVTSLKAATPLVPNLFIPDYGSRLTSAIYIRGIGSRINTPAVGLYVDNVPYVDKSAFDFHFYDIEGIDILRGPQGTLFGRNTMGGLVRVRTKNPFSYQGTTVHLGYASGDEQRNISLTHYHRVSRDLAFSAVGYYEGKSGFFRNDLTGKRVDHMQAAGGRMRTIWLPSDAWKLDASVSFDHSNEGAYPYYLVTEGSPMTGKISNNRESTYKRNMVNAGANLQYQTDKWQMNAITGYQYLRDRMFMDQDFIQDDIYSLEQNQRIHTITEELTLKNKDYDRWERVSGVNLMYQWLHTKAPVTFYKDGLRWLESNVNTMLPQMDKIPMMAMMGFKDMSINFRGDELHMDGIHDTPTFEAALFHQSTIHFNNAWAATLGFRLQYDHQEMHYNSPATVPFGFSMTNANNIKMAVNLQQLMSNIGYKGTLKNDRLSFLPKVSLKYDFDANNNIYTSVALGQRSGGYNLQMFSDLLQGSMRVDMIKGIKDGLYDYLVKLTEDPSINMPSAIPDPSNPGEMIGIPDFVIRTMDEKMPQFDVPTTEQVVYRPEYSWNYELGTHLTLLDKKLYLDAALFYSRIYDQQIARFAPSGLGRMMVNAGKSQSCGGEWSLQWTPNKHLSLSGNYGYTHSTFLEHDAGTADYSGNYVPFVPRHTCNLDVAYTWLWNTTANWGIHSLSVGTNVNGNGTIYWTEDNLHSQPFYTLLGARVSLAMKHANVVLWTKNLTGTRYNTFFFESASRLFEQHGKPRQLGIDVNLNF